MENAFRQNVQKVIFLKSPKYDSIVPLLIGILQENVKEMLDNAYIRERTEFKFYGGSKMNLQEIVTKKYSKGIADCSNEELYFALLEMTKAMAEKKENHNGKKNYIIFPQSS